MTFPAADPIPIPAPVWLMKLLSQVTLALHFAAVMILIGSLALVIWHDLIGRSKKDADQLSAGFSLARRLPVVMTYVINLGVPPLLFTQVLYGRAIYSSSVLIGVLWFSVIPLLMLAYWLLYATSSRLEAGKTAWVTALASLLIVVSIGHIYSMNMTLMLRPEVWNEMYAKSAAGLQGVTGDPTMSPRWMFVLAGGLVFGGLWSALLSNMKHISEGSKRFLRRGGGTMTAIGVLAQIACAFAVAGRQPEAVSKGLSGSTLHTIGGYLFLGAAAVALLLGLVQLRKSSVLLGWTGVLMAFLATAGAAIYRDGIRDFTLLQKGFDVWDRTEASNWSVIGVFLALFVIMLGVIAWLLQVMRGATVPKEQINL